MFQWIDTADVPLLIVDVAAVDVVAANRAARALFDGAFEGALPVPLSNVVRPAGSLEWAELMGPARDGRARTLALQTGGTRQLVHGSVRPLTDAHCLLSLTPVIDRDFQSAFVDILDELPVAIEIYDKDLMGVFYNKASDEIFLYEEKAIVHHDDWWAFGFPDPQERAAAYAEWKTKMEISRLDPSTIQFSEWKVRCRDGSTRIIQFRYRWVRDNYVLALWDVTTERETQQQLRHLAVSDPLTGLWNRRRLIDEGQRALELGLEEGSVCSLLLIDLDRFKQINDLYGHAAGDEVLRVVARRGLEQLRRSDVMARIGGEEFAVLLPHTGAAEARVIAERLLGAVRMPIMVVPGLVIQVTASIGVASGTRDDRSIEVLMARCDQALYAAKWDGRNRIIVDAPSAP